MHFLTAIGPPLSRPQLLENVCHAHHAEKFLPTGHWLSGLLSRQESTVHGSREGRKAQSILVDRGSMTGILFLSIWTGWGRGVPRVVGKEAGHLFGRGRFCCTYCIEELSDVGRK